MSDFSRLTSRDDSGSRQFLCVAQFHDSVKRGDAPTASPSDSQIERCGAPAGSGYLTETWFGSSFSTLGPEFNGPGWRASCFHSFENLSKGYG